MLDLQSLQDPYINRQTPSLGEIAARRLTKSGRTVGGRYTYASMLSQSSEEDFPPDSKYWKFYSEKALNNLIDIIGVESYKLFFSVCWPGETIEDLTWRTVCEMSEASLLVARSGERDIEKLAAAAHEKLESLIKEVL